ncbi:hypothetical protein GGTG_07439 [Gaeumannomyces tritici R3-111a-1]|uniref:Uncharacterized protein n=1 Tax=Gaeumannomyces tritici (strain R3-111a-1) TaxID=644352 RepID=J3P1P1_GAET3|nr:hypothetical protein GGTG_07439 [Gaeumannomyces tritici R3-111a-1]EJT73583.1 hypothetical protein GGTG_07439 [Gaeumannomyces tritici R3-111a-1]
MRPFSALYAAALAATTANALPEVRPVQLGSECHNYPAFNADTGEAGPWVLWAADNDGPVASGAGSDVSRVSDGASARFQISISVEPTSAKLALKCSNGTLLAYYQEWTPVTRGSDDKAFLLANNRQGGTAMQAHAHFLADGTQQEGVFLGSGGKTTWAYKYQIGQRGRKEFRIRLLVSSDSLEEGEFKGFIRFFTR